MNLKIFALLSLVLLGSCASPTPTVTVPKPANFVATVGSSTSVGLTWLKVDGSSTYELERKVADSSFTALVQIPHEAGGSSGQSFTNTALTPNTRYTYRIRAIKDGTPSDWNTSSEVQTPAVAATTYSLLGNWLGASNPNLYLTTNTGVNFSGATISVNGTPLAFRSSPGSYYAAAIPGATVGTVLNLSIAVPEGTITAQAAIPQAPTVTAPVADSNIRANLALEVTWTYSGTDPDRFYLQMLGAGSVNFVAANIPGSARSYTIPADQITVPSSGTVTIYLRAVNDGKSSFTGPIKPTSTMGVANLGQVTFNIVP